MISITYFFDWHHRLGRAYTNYKGFHFFITLMFQWKFRQFSRFFLSCDFDNWLQAADWCRFVYACRGVGTILKLGGPDINIQEGAFILQKLGGPNCMFCLISTKYWVGPGPPSPYPDYAPVYCNAHTYLLIWFAFWHETKAGGTNFHESAPRILLLLLWNCEFEMNVKLEVKI